MMRVALVLQVLLASELPCNVAAQDISPESSLNVFRHPDNGTVDVTSGGNQQGVVDVITANDLIASVRNGYRHIIIRSHLDLSDASGLPGMDPDALLVLPGHLAILVRTLVVCSENVSSCIPMSH